MPKIKELIDAVEESDMESEVKAEIGEILETHKEALIYCIYCGIGLKKDDETIQVRTGHINEKGYFEAEEDVAEDVVYYHATCFNRVTGWATDAVLAREKQQRKQQRKNRPTRGK